MSATGVRTYGQGWPSERGACRRLGTLGFRPSTEDRSGAWRSNGIDFGVVIVAWSLEASRRSAYRPRFPFWRCARPDDRRAGRDDAVP